MDARLISSNINRTVVGESSKDKIGRVTQISVRELVVFTVIRTRVFSSEENQKLYEADASDNRKEQTNPNLMKKSQLTLLSNVQS